MIKFAVQIKGISPLLFNRFPDEDNPDQKTKRATANLTMKEQVERSLYKAKDGKIYQPADHIIGSMVKAGVNFKLKGRKTFKDAMQSGLFVEPMQIIHENQKYVTDWRSVVIKSTRGRIMRGRGRLDSWKLKFTMSCLDPRATARDIKDILEYAGMYVGIGDYRPRYGRFEVVSFKEIK